MSCTKPKMSSDEIEEIITVHIKAFEEKIEEKLIENKERVNDIVLQQNKFEEDIAKGGEDAALMIENMKKDLMKNIDDGFLNNKKEFDKIFKENDKRIEEQFLILSKRLDDIELVIQIGIAFLCAFTVFVVFICILERDRLNKVVDMSGFMAAEVDMLVKKREDDMNIKIEKMEQKVQI